MKIEETYLAGCFVVTPLLFRDQRGFFCESFHQQKFEQATGLAIQFVQDNLSKSSKGVLRGLHYQKGAYAQAKLVSVMRGAVLDVCVDIRKDSPTYGKSFSLVLSDENRLQLFIPRGFAHGFVVLSETAEFFYKCDNLYAPAHEAGIHYDDPDLAIDWQLDGTELIISEKDQKLPSLREIEAQ